MGPGSANTRRADGMPIPWRDGCLEVQQGVEPGRSARDRSADTAGGVEDGGDDAAGRRTDLRPGGCLGDAPSRRVGARRPGYQDGNALADARTRFVVTMMRAPGKPMLELVDEEELEKRAHLRAPRPTD